MTSYCSWIYNRGPIKYTKLLSNILLVVCCSLLVFVWYCIPFIYNYQATFPFSFYPFSNLEILENLAGTINSGQKKGMRCCSIAIIMTCSTNILKQRRTCLLFLKACIMIFDYLSFCTLQDMAYICSSYIFETIDERTRRAKYLFCDTSHGLNNKSYNIRTTYSTKCSIYWQSLCHTTWRSNSCSSPNSSSINKPELLQNKWLICLRKKKKSNAFYRQGLLT